MRNKLLLLATAIGAFTAGFGVGAVGGFKAAVTDYVENDAQRIENQAVEMYEMLEKVDPEAEREESSDETSASVDSENAESSSRGFQ